VSRGDALIGNTDPDFTITLWTERHQRYRLLPFRSPSRSNSSSTPTGARGTPNTPTHDVLTALIAPSKDGDTLDDATLKNFFTLMVAAATTRRATP